MMAVIYLDHAATTPVLPEVLEAMEPYYKEKYGNPSSSYGTGTKRKEEIEEVRKVIADSINASPHEIYFTSGGTESDNWVLKGIRNRYINKNIGYVTSSIEHHAILHCCDSLKQENVLTTQLQVDEQGIVCTDQIENNLTDDTVLVSLMYANNETGAIQPVKKACYLCKEHNILFHTDAVQAYGHIPLDVKEDGVDFLSASAHKFGGPKGVGFLYIREGTDLPAMIDGGGQEYGKRAGTENVAGIVGMGVAAGLAVKRMEEDYKKIKRLRDYLERKLLHEIPLSRINGPFGMSRSRSFEPGRDDIDISTEKRLPGHLNISFQFIHGPELAALLDQEGICVSTGSACSSGSGNISHVLEAMQVPWELAGGTIRITIGRENTPEEMDRTAAVVRKSVEYLRKKSISYEDFYLAYSDRL
ncbi:MAG: cysteine desulfurase [Eubacterium sp.]|nr:cysteine desulfurase [Eubacterium sp.]